MKAKLTIVAVALAWLASPTFAHRLDEYLQATLVSIEPNRVRLEINLTPGVEIAESLLARIDGGRDGVISEKEAAAYAESLRRDLIVKMDGHTLESKLTASSFSPPAELRSGSGMMQMEFSAAPGSLSPGQHRLTVLNHHLPKVSVYLFNAAQPDFFTAGSSKSKAIEITAQKRNENQSAGEIEFTPRVAGLLSSLSHQDVRYLGVTGGAAPRGLRGRVLAGKIAPQPLAVFRARALRALTKWCHLGVIKVVQSLGIVFVLVLVLGAKRFRTRRLAPPRTRTIFRWPPLSSILGPLVITPLRLVSLRNTLTNLRTPSKFSLHFSSAVLIRSMTSQLLEDAFKVIPSQQLLVNVVSKRVRQLTSGHRPLIETGPRMGFSDIALTEIIEGKLKYEPAPEESKGLPN